MSLESLMPQPRRTFAIYDKLFFRTKIKKTSRFIKLKRDQIFNLFNQRPSHLYARKIAVERWYKSLCNQLEFLYLTNHCHAYDIKRTKRLSHNVFDWSYRDFLDRRQLKNCLWIDVLLRASTEECLDKQKIKVDILQLRKLVDLLYKTVLRVIRHCKVDLGETLWRPLRNVDRFFKLEEFHKERHSAIVANMQRLKERMVMFDVVKCLSKQSKHVNTLEEMVSNTDIWCPIEKRYLYNWYRNIVNQNQQMTDINNLDTNRVLQYYKTKTLNEKIRDNGVLNAYYSDTGEYKRRVVDLQERFDAEADELDNEMNYMIAQIDKLRASKRNLIKEINRYHFEIEKRLALEAKWLAEAEEKRLAREAHLAALAAEALRQQQMQEQRDKKAAASAKKKK